MPSDFPARVAFAPERPLVVPFAHSTVANENSVKAGELVVWDDTNNWVERAGADPTTILGISLGDSNANRLITPDNKVPIQLLTSDVVVAMSSPVDYVEGTHRMQEYGIARSAAGNWRVDTTDTTNVCVVVIDGDVGSATGGTQNTFFVKFLATDIASEGVAS